MYVYDGQVVDINLPLLIGGNQYPAGWFLEPAQRIRCEIVEGVSVAPSFDPATQRAQELPPVQIDGIWTQQWEIVNLTQEQITSRIKALVPRQVTRRQARQALLLNGLIDDVPTVIATMPDAMQRRLAEIEWEDSQFFERDRPLVNTLGGALGLTDAQIDALFIQAATL